MELSRGGVALGREGVRVDGGRDAVERHVDQGRDPTRRRGRRGGGEALPGRVTGFADMHVGVDKAGEHNGVRADCHLLGCRRTRTEREQRCDHPIAHTDGPGLLPTTYDDPFGADKEVKHTIFQGATMYLKGTSPQLVTVLWRPSRRRV